MQRKFLENNLMKLFNSLIILFFLTNCSFDNKTGIWKNENLTSNTKIKQFDGFKSISSTEKKFNKIVNLIKIINLKKTM